MRASCRLSGSCVRSRGFTLVELMISLVLGLIVIGGVVSVLLSNKQSYRTNEGLSQIQESARSAFELMARDVRQAGATGCSNTDRIANVLDPTKSDWWGGNWFGIQGYDGGVVDPAVGVGAYTSPPVNNRINGTDSLQLQGIQGTPLAVEKHVSTSAMFFINAETTDLASDDIIIVCDFDHAVILQISSYNSSNVTLVHNSGNGSGSIGNCSKGLGYPTLCPPDGNNFYPYGPNSQISRFSAVDWYIGDNGRATEGGRSLFRRRLGSAASFSAEEMVAGVTNMQILYRVAGSNDFVTATTVNATPANWLNVNAVSVELTFDSADQRVTTDPAFNSGRLQRTFTNIITLRNRVP